MLKFKSKNQKGVIARKSTSWRTTKQSHAQIATLLSVARNDKEKKWSLAMTKKIVILTFLFLSFVFIQNFLLPKTALAATYADAAKAMCLAQKSKNHNYTETGTDQYILGEIDGTSITVLVSKNSSPVNGTLAKQWILVNTSCSSTIASSQGVNVNDNYSDAFAGATATGSATAGTPAATTPAAGSTAPAAATTPTTTAGAAPAAVTLTIPQITGVHLTEWITSQNIFTTIWKAMVGIMDILVIVGFIVFGLANVFHIKYDEYQAKKAIPGLIVGVILANLSYSICIFFIGAVQYLTNIFAGDPTAFWASFGQLYGWVWTLAGSVGVAGALLSGTGPGIIIAALFIFLIPVIIMFAMGFIIWIRAFGIIALIGFAPVAFLLQSFPIQIPFLSDLAKKWWDYFFKLLFVAPIMFFLFWLAFTINGAAQNNNAPATNSTTTGNTTTASYVYRSGPDNLMHNDPESTADCTIGFSTKDTAGTYTRLVALMPKVNDQATLDKNKATNPTTVADYASVTCKVSATALSCAPPDNHGNLRLYQSTNPSVTFETTIKGVYIRAILWKGVATNLPQNAINSGKECWHFQKNS